MSEALKIQLLGGFSVHLNGQPIHAWRSAKTRALLAYLAVEPDREHSRAGLATMLWGELPDTTAKTNLRIELSNLKSVLSAHRALEFSRTTACFRSVDATVDVTVDVLAFREAVTAFLNLPVESQAVELPRLSAALALYQGEFLAGFHLNDATEFEDWQLFTSEKLHEQMMLALSTLQLRYAEQGLWAELAEAARRQIAIVPWTESAHRSLIQALAAQGQVAAALLQYEKCREILQEELGVEPSLSTQELAARLRGNGAAAPAVQHNLTQQLKSFVGRSAEIQRLEALVKTEKLVTLLGIGGVGKSHLAQAVAQKVLHSFRDGVWFVPLTNIEAGETATEQIALAIAAAIGFQITDMQSPLAELATYLAPKQTLLVLDNWEHLVESAAAVFYALLNHSAVHILATSRVRLMVEGEILFPLEGLSPHEAYTLFVERARRIVPGFALQKDGQDDPEIREDIARVCEQVAGLPLGIELATTWVEHYSVAEIGQSIAGIAIQPQQTDTLVRRHHQLTNVFEYSWKLLSAHQQQILSSLSIFRGGFDRTAATAVTESTLGDLSALIGYSLVQRVTAGRYDLHPLIQEFAFGKLAPTLQTTLFSKYSDHYLTTLIQTERGQRARHLLADFQNLRTAWRRAVHARDESLVSQTLSPMSEFIGQFGLLQDGNQLFADAVARFEGVPEWHELVAQLLDQQSKFLHGLYGLGAATVLVRRMLSLTNDRHLQAVAHDELANYHAEAGEWEQANFHFDQIEALAQESSDLTLYINTVESRIYINALHFRGDLAQGIARLEEMLALLETATTPITDKETLRIRLLQSLDLVAVRYGDYALSLRYGKEAMTWANELGLRRRRGHLLLDLALAEQFAGMYDEAIAHNLEALALSEEIGDVDDMGLLSANLCLTMRQSGELEQALSYGRKAIEILATLDHKRMEGQARNRVGHTLLALARWADAYAEYGEALAVWAIVQHPNRYEALAGRAVAALHLDKHAEAVALVDEVLAFTGKNGLLGIVEPVRLLLTCEVGLSEAGQKERTHQVLSQAENWVQTIADRISDDGVRATFLHNRPDNQRLHARLAAFRASQTPDLA